MVEIEPGHCYYWILKPSGHNYFHDYCRILKQSRHDFSGKHLYGGYCMDIMCCLYVHGFENPYKKFSEILPSHSGIIVVLSNE